MQELTFVTSNKGKVEEARQILDVNLERENVELKEIQAIETAETAQEKARQAYKELNKPVIVDDTGLFLEEWNSFPGALVKWVLKSKSAEGVCELASNNNSATAKTTIGLCIDGEVKTFTGEVKGRIAKEPQGKDGFGWDPVFIPEGYEQTFAQMSSEEKNQISMRKKALHKLKDYLEQEK